MKMGKYLVLACGLLLLPVGSAIAQPKQPMKLTTQDYLDIYQLYAAYSRALDEGNGAGRIGTFTTDGTFSWNQSKHQPEDMATLKKRTDAYGHKDRPVGGHLLTNIHITPTADGADGSCYALLGGGAPDKNGQYLPQPAFYQDKLVKTPAGWRFKTREVWMASETPPREPAKQ